MSFCSNKRRNDERTKHRSQLLLWAQRTWTFNGTGLDVYQHSILKTCFKELNEHDSETEGYQK